MIIVDGYGSRRRRDSWRRNPRPRQPARARPSCRAPAGAPLDLGELLARLSNGRLNAKMAGELLRVGPERISMHIQIDANTGFVECWRLLTEKDSATSVFAAGQPAA